MDVVQKEIDSRKAEIQSAVKMLFNTNMKITDWDVPEADDKKAANMIVDIFQEVIDEIKDDIRAGKYDYY